MTALAHQGGWDEILLVLVPVIAFGVALWLANHRANDRVEQCDRDNADNEPAPPS